MSSGFLESPEWGLRDGGGRSTASTQADGCAMEPQDVVDILLDVRLGGIGVSSGGRGPGFRAESEVEERSPVKVRPEQ